MSKDETSEFDDWTDAEKTEWHDGFVNSYVVRVGAVYFAGEAFGRRGDVLLPQSRIDLVSDSDDAEAFREKRHAEDMAEHLRDVLGGADVKVEATE